MRQRIGISALILAGLVIVSAVIAPSCADPASSFPPVKYGQLKVKGNLITDAKGNPVQLKGMSTAGLQWYGGIVNEAAFTALVKDWGCDVLRLALYVGENGYSKDPSLKTLVESGVDLAIKLGVYVIIDWHVLTPGNPNDPIYKDAEAFFTEMSRKYGKYPNVMYEIMNEPNGPLSWEKDMKPYAQKLVKAIRRNDPDNIILIGSGTWSQDVDVAAADPVPGKNLAYTVHFYSGTHGQQLRDKVQSALDSNAAVFCTEWGTSEANGTGGPYINAAEEWLAFFDKNTISWVNWSLSNKNETSAALKGLLQEYRQNEGNVILQKETPLVPETISSEGYPVWDVSELSKSGAYVRAKIKGVPVPTYTSTIASWNFENGMQGWFIPDDSGAKPKTTVETVETRAIRFPMKWSENAMGDLWGTAPRFRLSDTKLQLGKDTAVMFDLYLEAGKPLKKTFDVVPVLQYPPSWWKQLPAVRLNYEDGEPVGNGLLKYSVSAPMKLTSDVMLEHLVIVIVGQGTGYEGTVALDNIALVNLSNGDTPKKIEAADDNAGTFTKLPWDFEDGTRQGWSVTEDSPAKVKLEVGTAESKAVMFNYGWKIPGPSDPWNAAPRITSSFVDLKGSDYKAVSLDFYIEAGKATTGYLEVQPVIQVPQHGYWFQMNPVRVEYAGGIKVGKLLKYGISVPLVSNTGAALAPDAVLRNLIFLTVGVDTDYQGAIYYDNITYKK